MKICGCCGKETGRYRGTVRAITYDSNGESHEHKLKACEVCFLITSPHMRVEDFKVV